MLWVMWINMVCLILLIDRPKNQKIFINARKHLMLPTMLVFSLHDLNYFGMRRLIRIRSFAGRERKAEKNDRYNQRNTLSADHLKVVVFFFYKAAHTRILRSRKSCSYYADLVHPTAGDVDIAARRCCHVPDHAAA